MENSWWSYAIIAALSLLSTWLMYWRHESRLNRLEKAVANTIHILARERCALAQDLKALLETKEVLTADEQKVLDFCNRLIASTQTEHGITVE